MYDPIFSTCCLPTEPLIYKDKEHAPPTPGDLERAVRGGHGRLVAGYEIMSVLVTEARWHLAKTLPVNWAELPECVAAVAWLGGPAELARLAQATDTVEGKLP